MNRKKTQQTVGVIFIVLGLIMGGVIFADPFTVSGSNIASWGCATASGNFNIVGRDARWIMWNWQLLDNMEPERAYVYIEYLDGYHETWTPKIVPRKKDDGEFRFTFEHRATADVNPKHLYVSGAPVDQSTLEDCGFTFEADEDPVESQDPPEETSTDRSDLYMGIVAAVLVIVGLALLLGRKR